MQFRALELFLNVCSVIWDALLIREISIQRVCLRDPLYMTATLHFGDEGADYVRSVASLCETHCSIHDNLAS